MKHVSLVTRVALLFFVGCTISLTAIVAALGKVSKMPALEGDVLEYLFHSSWHKITFLFLTGLILVSIGWWGNYKDEFSKERTVGRWKKNYKRIRNKHRIVCML